jgi:hypothetical protein
VPLPVPLPVQKGSCHNHVGGARPSHAPPALRDSSPGPGLVPRRVRSVVCTGIRVEHSKRADSDCAPGRGRRARNKHDSGLGKGNSSEPADSEHCQLHWVVRWHCMGLEDQHNGGEHSRGGRARRALLVTSTAAAARMSRCSSAQGQPRRSCLLLASGPSQAPGAVTAVPE